MPIPGDYGLGVGNHPTIGFLKARAMAPLDDTSCWPCRFLGNWRGERIFLIREGGFLIVAVKTSFCGRGKGG